MEFRKKQRQQRATTTRYAPADVRQRAADGDVLIIVERDFDDKFVPDGYTKMELNSQTDKFIALVPQKALFYMDSYNFSNGSIEDGLNVLEELYAALEAADTMFEGSSPINASASAFAMTVRQNYQTLLTNSLLTGQSRDGNEDDKVESAEFDNGQVERLCLAHDYVRTRMEGIAAIARGVSINDIKKRELKDVLGFDTQHEVVERVRLRDVADLDPRRRDYDLPQKQEHMICTGASYYFLKPELRDGKDGWEYDLHSGTRRRTEFLPSEWTDIGKLEQDIQAYQKKHSPGQITERDTQRMRAATNIEYGAGLDVNPAAPAAERKKQETGKK